MPFAMNGLSLYGLSRLGRRLGRLSSSASSPSSSAVQSRDDRLDEDSVKNVEPRIRRRKPRVEPVLKSLLLGRFDGEMLAFPETLDKDEIETLKANVADVQGCASLSAADAIRRLKALGLYGAPALAFHGGVEAIATERCRLVEAFGARLDVAEAVSSQWLGVDFLARSLPAGEEREARLRETGTGRADVRVALEEPLSDDPGAPAVRSVYVTDATNRWYLTGDKAFRPSEFRDGYVVTVCKNFADQPDLFLLRTDASGFQRDETRLTFQNTPATALGRNFGEDQVDAKIQRIIDDSMTQHRLEVSCMALSILREAVRVFVEHTRNKYVMGKSISELPLIQDGVADAAVLAYACESMIYYTAGLIDGYEEPDAAVEAIACQTYVTRAAHDSIVELLCRVGPHEPPAALGELLRAADALMTAREHSDALRTYAMLLALQHAGRQIAEDVRKARNPFAYPGFNFRRLFRNRGQEEDDPECDLRLAEYLHPSLKDGAKTLEYCVMRLKYATEILLGRHGLNVVEEHRSLKRLCEVTIETFSSLASLSRASRSYCIGLHLAENELTVAYAISLNVYKKVKRLVLEIEEDYYKSLDCVRTDVGKKAFERGGIYHEHSLERVFF